MPVSRSLWNRRIKARDGIELAADVLLPQGNGPFPTVVLRTPYVRGRHLDNAKSWPRLVDRGYALVTVDMRGRNDSEGEWKPWVRDTDDAYDAIEWVSAQSWCNGKIGMVGASYEGLSQWWTAAAQPKNLACIVPLCMGGIRCAIPFYGVGIASQYRLWWSTLVLGRTQQYAGAPSWEAYFHKLPLRTLDERLGLRRSAWQKYIEGETDFGGPAGTLALDEYPSINIPILVMVGWWDDQETMRAWVAAQSTKSAHRCQLVIGAWDHAGNLAPRPTLGGVDVSASMMDTIAYVEQFLALHLKSDSSHIGKSPRCRVFLTGENRWDELDQWPHPAAAETPYYLTSAGDARSLYGNGQLVIEPEISCGQDTYVYDPNNPPEEMSNLATFIFSDAPLDLRYLQRRQDVLVYTTPVLTEPLMVSGRYKLCVFLSSDRPDTDIFVNLSDIHPDGRAITLAPTLVHSASLRLRYRNGAQPELMKVGEIYEVWIDGSWLHHIFKPGHRARISISSGNFPLMTRNAGTGGPWADDEVLYAQTNTVHHSDEYPSRVILPIVIKEQEDAFS